VFLDLIVVTSNHERMQGKAEENACHS